MRSIFIRSTIAGISGTLLNLINNELSHLLLSSILINSITILVSILTIVVPQYFLKHSSPQVKFSNIFLTGWLAFILFLLGTFLIFSLEKPNPVNHLSEIAIPVGASAAFSFISALIISFMVNYINARKSDPSEALDDLDF